MMDGRIRSQSNSLLFVISAPSGAGKTTLCRNLLAGEPRLSRIITCTTREPRANESHGRDYHFLSEAEFQSRIEAGAFLEHARVFGHRYGTLREDVLATLRSGKDALLNIDVQGERSVRRYAKDDSVLKPALVTVFMMTPTWEELERRLRSRNADDPEMIARRLETARVELACRDRFDYLLVSSSIEEDCRRARCILEAERMRTSRCTDLAWADSSGWGKERCP